MSQALMTPPPVLFMPQKQPAKPLTRRFKVVSEYEPAGDQPTAITELVRGVAAEDRDQVLLGVTGSGKTFTMAKVIEAVQKPTLILAPNKTLAAQLYGEMKSFFPDNAVEYFVSYYDYYQPEAYVPRTDTYIEKDAQINEQIDRMRHAATQMLLERNDVVIVASVSCIYGIGSVETYAKMVVKLETGGRIDRDTLARALVELQYRRNDTSFQRGNFRLRGEVIDIWPSHYEDRAWRVSLFGDEIEQIHEFDPLTGEKAAELKEITIYANSHYVTPRPTLAQAIRDIKVELKQRVEELQQRGQAAGNRTPDPAHHVRHRNDGNHRVLQGDRELLTLSDRPRAGRSAADLVRISAGKRPADRRRKPRHRAATGRHVSRRLQPQKRAVGIRFPAAVLHRQPAAEIRGMGTLPSHVRVRFRDARPVGDGAHRRRVRRAGHSPHRPDRSGHGNPTGGASGRRSAGGMPAQSPARAAAFWSPR